MRQTLSEPELSLNPTNKQQAGSRPQACSYDDKLCDKQQSKFSSLNLCSGLTIMSQQGERLLFGDGGSAALSVPPSSTGTRGTRE
uniref:Uncharacterized protein n=1 Tax=Arundo donax TaxID=35708 RepID=A0A0A9CVU8_ARUDO